MYNKLKANKKGFTLIELIVVIAIIAILVLMATPKFLGYTKDANVAAMRADAKVLSGAALQYNIEEDGAWPVGEAIVAGTGDEDLKADSKLGVLLTSKGATLNKIDETLVKKYVKNTKNPISEYGVVVTEGNELEGEVFHLTGIENKAGTAQFGVAKSE